MSLDRIDLTRDIGERGTSLRREVVAEPEEVSVEEGSQEGVAEAVATRTTRPVSSILHPERAAALGELGSHKSEGLT